MALAPGRVDYLPIGQPFRIGSLDAVWCATGSEIVAHFAGLGGRSARSDSMSRD